MTEHRVDVVIPTYNGRKHLTVCLQALERQVFTDFGVIVVDDGSADDTAEFVRQVMPAATVLCLERNRGFVSAVNLGIGRSSAELVALLNNDTEPEPDWLDALVAALDRHLDAAAAASKLRLFDRREVIHSAGDEFSRRGVPENRGVWQRDVGQFDLEEEVFGACGAAALYRRRALDEVAAIDGAVLDPDLVMYCEDVDLSWRLRLLGHHIVYAPNAVVYHRLSATGGGPRASYYVARNTLAVLAKDVPSTLMRRYLWRILSEQVRQLLTTLPHLGEPAARAKLRGTLAFPRLLPVLLRKRRRIQAARRVDLEAIDSLLVR